MPNTSRSRTDWIVLFTLPDSGVSAPSAFHCQAADMDEAEALCSKSHPECLVVWAADVPDSDAAQRDYYARSLVSPGQWVIWRDPDGDLASGPAVVVEARGESVLLRAPDGGEIEALYSEIDLARPTVKIGELQAEADRLLGRLKALVGSSLVDKGDIPEECQRRFILNRIAMVEQALNGMEPEDLVPGPVGATPGRWVEITPEADWGGRIVPVDAPGERRWFIPIWELQDLCVDDDDRVDDSAVDLGNAPAWVRAWGGPFTVRLVDQVGGSAPGVSDAGFQPPS